MGQNGNTKKAAKSAEGSNRIEIEFGSVLRQVRIDRGMTQEQLAWATGIERAYISELERGLKSPTLNRIMKLAAGLGVSATSLMKTLEDVLTAR